MSQQHSADRKDMTLELNRGCDSELTA